VISVCQTDISICTVGISICGSRKRDKYCRKHFTHAGTELNGREEIQFLVSSQLPYRRFSL
ncbi:hypothetical protein GBAR_LOCUS18250, partial [Geodia barretti]